MLKLVATIHASKTFDEDESKEYSQFSNEEKLSSIAEIKNSLINMIKREGADQVDVIIEIKESADND